MQAPKRCERSILDDSSVQSSPLLQVRQTRQYTGATTRAVVYANPTGTQQDNTLEYTFLQEVNVLQADSNAPANFDVQSSYTYTVVQDPGTGAVPKSEVVDTYENLLTSGNSQQITQLGAKTVTVSNDETSNALGASEILSAINYRSGRIPWRSACKQLIPVACATRAVRTR